MGDRNPLPRRREKKKFLAYEFIMVKKEGICRAKILFIMYTNL